MVDWNQHGHSFRALAHALEAIQEFVQVEHAVGL